MSQFRENKIDYFQAMTNWKDRQRVIDFLEAFDWNLEFAIDGYLTNSRLNDNDQPTPPIFYRMNSRGRESLFKSSNETNEQLMEELRFSETHSNGQQHASNQTSIDSSHRLHNSSISEQIPNNSDQTIETSNIISFYDHVEALYLSNVNTIFPDINRFNNKKQQLLQYIDSNIIGKDVLIKTPWATRKLIYADYTASGRSLTFLEHYILTYVLPYYANTHSENNACALQTTKYREGSRKLIKKYVNATDDDVVIFTGSGSTAAINKLVDVLHLKDEENRNNMVVFISTFEHHSNILPWKETGIEIVRIPNNKQGLLDRENLTQQLKYYHDTVKKHIICTFNAASNVTGIRTDVDTISTLVHEYDGWVFWDYAAAAPYVKIDMNAPKTAYKDAVFISTHKFVGGPGTPGLLIGKKTLFTNRAPSACGGGTVNYVTRTHTEYVKDIETREEGGTPNILGSIRAGLVFHLKESVGHETIEAREDELVDKFFKRFKNHKTLFVLGSSTAHRLAIFAFLIYVPTVKKYLHHNFLCSLLNDLFGIQVRSGCSCAGPYVLDLLDIDDKTAEIYTKFITEDENSQFDGIGKNALMKPGFTRFNLSYFASDEEVDYILNALEFIANDGWKFLPLYTYDVTTAVWHPRYRPSENHSSQFHSLRMINYDNGTMEETTESEKEILNSNFHQFISSSSLEDPIDQAKLMAKDLPKFVCDNINCLNDAALNISDKYKDFIWFVTPKEIFMKMLIQLEQEQQNNHVPVPFRPRLNNE